jgi:hypothetical protein
MSSQGGCIVVPTLFVDMVGFDDARAGIDHNSTRRNA